MKRPPAATFEALWVIFSQLSFGILLLGILALKQPLLMMASLAGTLIAVLPNILIFRQLFKFFGAPNSRQIMKAFYWGEAIKFILTGVLFTVALKFFHLSPLGLLLGFAVTQLGYWFGPLTWRLVKPLVLLGNRA